MFKQVFRFLFFVIALFALTFVLGLMILKYNEPLRKKTMSYLLATVTSHRLEHLDKLRCELVTSVTGGRILEIGIGTAINFLCLDQESSPVISTQKDKINSVRNKVTEWIGIDFNEKMFPYAEKSTKNHSIPFPVKLKVMNAENLTELTNESIDNVLITHVLCSVEDVDTILNELYRVLKKGGKILFLEHVSADGFTKEFDEKYPYIKLLQKFIEPAWKIAGDGCRFRQTWKHVEKLEKKFNMKVKYERVDLEHNFSVVKPHIIGEAVKI
ncbi:hypothetical protein ABK040_006288 [Willaertia magna]